MITPGKFIGSVFIILGSALGAGMLALPIVSAHAGFLPASLLLIVIWLTMTFSGLLTLEVALAFKLRRNTFNTMAFATLGRPGQVIAWIAMILLLYATLVAYIAGESSLITSLCEAIFNITIPAWINSLFFTVVFGAVVYWSTQSVDYLVRVLLSFKGVLLVIMLVLLLPHISFINLFHQKTSLDALWLATPFFLNTFGFQFVVPSIITHVGIKPRTLKWIIVSATTILLVIYLLWLVTALGIVPITGPQSFTAANSDVGRLIQCLIHLIQSPWVGYCVDGFTNIAVLTSFLGVGLGLFDFVADGFKRENTAIGRLQSAGITFVPPLLFALLFPGGFLFALHYSAIFGVILELMLPVLMVYQLRKSAELTSPYHAFGGTPLLWVIFFVGMVIIVVPFLV